MGLIVRGGSRRDRELGIVRDALVIGELCYLLKAPVIPSSLAVYMCLSLSCS